LRVLWAIQKHESSPTPGMLHDACQRVGTSVIYQAWNDSEVPELGSDGNVIFYGSCAFIDSIALMNRWNPDVYFDSAAFCYRSYIEAYGDAMLNRDAVFTELGSLERLALYSQKKLFIRSENDSKRLSGSVWTNEQLRRYVGQLEQVHDLEMLTHPIVVNSKKTIDFEWRVFLVNGLVSSGSQYRYFGDLCCTPGIPADVHAFAERLAAFWSPAQVFVMDVAKCDNALFVLELNGFNSCGFYSSDVAQIIRDVEQLITRTVA
jgi:hypothetical protein